MYNIPICGKGLETGPCRALSPSVDVSSISSNEIRETSASMSGSLRGSRGLCLVNLLRNLCSVWYDEQIYIESLKQVGNAGNSF
jgi:hypothetical protein